MARLKLEFTGFDQYKKLLGGLEQKSKQIAEEALKASFNVVTPKAQAAVAKANLPAGGKYSTGETESSLRQSPEIHWKGTEAEVSVGFNIAKGGLPSLFMMYGTPRYMKVQAVYDAFYSDQTEGELARVQGEIYDKAVEELFG